MPDTFRTNLKAKHCLVSFCLISLSMMSFNTTPWHLQQCRAQITITMQRGARRISYHSLCLYTFSLLASRFYCFLCRIHHFVANKTTLHISQSSSMLRRASRWHRYYRCLHSAIVCFQFFLTFFIQVFFLFAYLF